MIYTITLNPSLDYIASCEDFKLGCTNRTTSEVIFPGGKGINVSIVLANLGDDNTALGFIAGFTGNHIKEELLKMGINSQMIKLNKGVSRINLKLRSKEETELNGLGPAMDEEDLGKLYEQLDELKSDDILILAGSIPSSLPSSLYQNIMERLRGRGIRIVVDATKELLLNVLKEKPFLIKPNIHELAEMFGVRIDSFFDALPYAKKLKEMGAVNVIISMGKDGAFMIDEDSIIHQMAAPKGKLINSVGSGDSLVAGFIHQYLKTNDYEDAFRYGVCTGSASAFSMNLATKEEVERLYKGE